jgi:hypothetical protein
MMDGKAAKPKVLKSNCKLNHTPCGTRVIVSPQKKHLMHTTNHHTSTAQALAGAEHHPYSMQDPLPCLHLIEVLLTWCQSLPG